MNKDIVTRLHLSNHSPYIYLNGIKYTFSNLDDESKLSLRYVKFGENISYKIKDNKIYRLRFVSKLDIFLIKFVLFINQ